MATNYIQEAANKNSTLTQYAIEKYNDALPSHSADAVEAGTLIGATVNTFAELRKKRDRKKGTGTIN